MQIPLKITLHTYKAITCVGRTVILHPPISLMLFSVHNPVGTGPYNSFLTHTLNSTNYRNKTLTAIPVFGIKLYNYVMPKALNYISPSSLLTKSPRHQPMRRIKDSRDAKLPEVLEFIKVMFGMLFEGLSLVRWPAVISSPALNARLLNYISSYLDRGIGDCYRVPRWSRLTVNYLSRVLAGLAVYVYASDGNFEITANDKAAFTHANMFVEHVQLTCSRLGMPV
jgi:hypothetical protein